MRPIPKGEFSPDIGHPVYRNAATGQYFLDVDNLRGMSPMNQRAEDLMMNAPSEATLKQLREPAW